MKKKTHLVLGLIVAIFALIILYSIISFLLKSSQTISPGANAPDISNMSYVVGSDIFNLKDGKAEKEYVLNHSEKNTLSILGEPIYGDFDGDKDTDAAVVLVNNPGTSGTYYYVALVINNAGDYKVSNALYLGDRIAPQAVIMRDGKLIVTYADRKEDDPMTESPSVIKNTWISYDRSTGEISQIPANQ